MNQPELPDSSPKMHDSGARRQFDSGAVRDLAADKPRIDLISPFALWRIGKWYGLGAVKYDPRNWEKGIPFNAMYASMFRHVVQWGMGERYPEYEDHLSAVTFGAAGLIHNEEMVARRILPATLDDMPDYRPRRGK